MPSMINPPKIKAAQLDNAVFAKRAIRHGPYLL